MFLFRFYFIEKCQPHLHHQPPWRRPMLFIIITSILIIIFIHFINIIWKIQITFSIHRHLRILLPMIFFSNKQISNQTIPIYSILRKVFLHLHQVPMPMLRPLGQSSCNIIHINNIHFPWKIIGQRILRIIINHRPTIIIPIT